MKNVPRYQKHFFKRINPKSFIINQFQPFIPKVLNGTSISDETIDKINQTFEVNLPYKIKENNVVRHLLSLLEGTQYNGLLKDFIEKSRFTCSRYVWKTWKNR